MASSDKIWWWLDEGAQRGASHMATDLFFAEHIQEIGCPVMRVYTWEPGCISLGYHQKSDCIDLSRCEAAKIDVVRRPTGGRAVYHAEELTYSVVLPANWMSEKASVADTYDRLSEGLVRGLRLLGIPAEFAKRHSDLKYHYKTQESVSCFSAAALHEIVVNDQKLVGSAQRIWPAAVLQHGSILAGPEHLKLPGFLKGLSAEVQGCFQQELDRKTTSISQVLGRQASYQEIQIAIQKGMEETIGITFEDFQKSSVQIREIEKLESGFSIYQSK